MKRTRNQSTRLSIGGVLFLAIAVIWYTQQNDSGVAANQPAPAFTIQTIVKDDGSFGYNILVDDRVLIHQPHIPAVQGIKGFDSEQAARNVADVVVGKLMRNEIPSVSVEELRELNVVD